ncbi:MULTISPECIES: glycosyltransferase [Pseudomonadota]|uniref:glycosyltransferase n=1 Tax=Pseudomonadota TaxID=1224 RepID=UPI003A8F54A6
MTVSSRLAIAAPSFTIPSETFVRAHIATILPEKTVLICEDGTVSENFGMPVLSEIDAYPMPRNKIERLHRAIRFYWGVYVERALRGGEERRIRSFLTRQGVTHCLAEFGPMGCKMMHATDRAGVRLFVHFHGYDATRLPREAGWRRHYRALFVRAEGIIAPSRFIADRLAEMGCPRNKLHVSACGISPEDFAETRRVQGMALAIGRFVDKKAPLTTIRAWVEATQDLPDAHLHMIGDGPLLEAAHALIAELNAGGRITLHGAQPHEKVRGLLRRSSLFLQHSVTARDGDTEGLPVAILEAMASAIPVISTRHSGIPDVVREGEMGLLVDEHDIDAMVQAIRTLLKQPERAQVMGMTGAPYVRAEFSHEATAERLRRIMEI